MIIRKKCLIYIGFLLLIPNMAFAAISVVDDAGNIVSLSSPAQKIISLAPHLTELLFAIDAGSRLVGTVEHSDYPLAANQIRRIGGYHAIDLESIIALQPDLIIAWKIGNNPVQIEKLQSLGIPVFINEPRHIEDIPDTVRRLAVLTGKNKQAKVFIGEFEQQHAILKKRFAGRRPVKLFYEIWHQPLMTINGEDLISDVIRLCGAVNVFSDVPASAPTVSVESVLQTLPDIIVIGGMREARRDWLTAWQPWSHLPAVANEQLYFIDPDLMQRHGSRILQGAEQLCQYVEQARKIKYAND